MRSPMTRCRLNAIALLAAFALAPHAGAATKKFAFGVIAHPLTAVGAESAIRTAIEQTDADNLAFVVANGIKAADEPCTDTAYNRRKALLGSAKNGLIVSLAESDWAPCKDENGKSAAIGRLSRLRDMFFPDRLSFGATRIPLVHQSANPKFRTYVENARWEIGDILFATIDLPANNNHYLFEAGRNSEFEDRLVANRNWLHQIFTYAKYKKLQGVVLFSDGNPFSPPAKARSRRDGFAETRHQLASSAAGFPGKVLVIHGPEASATGEAARIRWNGKLGELAIGPGWTRINATPGTDSVFGVANAASEKRGDEEQAQ
jgi:hypothetical protein